MKFHVISFLALFFALTGNAYAAGEKDGFERAEALCNDLLYPKEKDECFAAVAKAKFIQIEAVKVCENLLYAAEKIECVSTIGNKTYTKASIEECDGRLYAKDKISCLQLRGRQSASASPAVAPDTEYLKSSLRRALELMRQGNHERARAVLTGLLESLE